MSVRRLADDSVQPATFAFSAENARWAQRRIALYPEGRQQSAVIPLLMRAQGQEGWLTRAAIEAIAGMLGMPYIRVLEVATFYTQFLLKPVGSRAHIQLCGTTPCMLRGAEALRGVLEERIGHEQLTVSPDGTLSWEEVECLGACVNAPMIAIGPDTYEDLTPARLGAIVGAFARGDGASVPTGPQNGRLSSEPEGGRVTLVEVATAEREAYTPAPTEAPAAVAAAPQEPTTKGRPRDVQEEGAPAIKGPSPGAKVSEGKAEAERLRADAAANADGEPNRAMREDATGAETSASKVDGGKATGQRKRGGAPDAAAGGGVGTRARKGRAASQGARADVDPDTPGAAGTPAGGATQTSADTDTSPPTREIGGRQSDDGKGD